MGEIVISVIACGIGQAIKHVVSQCLAVRSMRIVGDCRDVLTGIEAIASIDVFTKPFASKQFSGPFSIGWQPLLHSSDLLQRGEIGRDGLDFLRCECARDTRHGCFGAFDQR